MTRHQPTRSGRRRERFPSHQVALGHRAAAGLRWLALAQVAAVLVLSPAQAGQRCWPAEVVENAHAEQGDEVILTYDSMMRENSVTIIYRDPADGVVTAVGIDTNGVACIFDVGRSPADEEQQAPVTGNLE